MQFNFDNSQQSGRIENGEYLCKIADVQEKTTRNGDGMWAVTFTIMPPSGCAGKPIYDNLVNSPKAKGRFKEFFEALGVDTSGIKDILPGSIIGQQLLVTVNLVEEEYQGVKKMKPKIPFSGGFRMIEADYTPGPTPF